MNMKYIIAFVMLNIFFASQVFGQFSKILDVRDSLKKAHVFHIMFKDQTQAANTLAYLRTISENRRFQKFKEIAKEKSIDPGSALSGGDIQLVNQGELDEAFDAAVFSLSLREVSDPIKSKFGWHLVYIDSMSFVPISQICNDSLVRYAKTSPDNLKSAIKITNEISSRETLIRVDQILGRGWSKPMQDPEGELTYFRSDSSPNPVGLSTLTQHIEYKYARLDSKSQSCKRSAQQQYLIDCNSGIVTWEAFSEYELRGGVGRVLHSHTLHPKVSSNISSAGGFVKQLHSMACQKR